MCVFLRYFFKTFIIIWWLLLGVFWAKRKVVFLYLVSGFCCLCFAVFLGVNSFGPCYLSQKFMAHFFHYKISS